jgi:hypothetical protein
MGQAAPEYILPASARLGSLLGVSIPIFIFLWVRFTRG